MAWGVGGEGAAIVTEAVFATPLSADYLKHKNEECRGWSLYIPVL